jgi:hypothetical protein
MENRPVTSNVTKGLIISLVLIVIDLIAGFAKFKFETWFTWIPTIVLCIMLIWACISYANQMSNSVTFGNVFAHGFKTTAVVACLMLIYTLLSVFVIFPETKELALEKAREQMEKDQRLSESDIENGIEMTRKLFLPFAIAGSVIGTLIVGAIASLIGAAFARKNPPSPFQNPS